MPSDNKDQPMTDTTETHLTLAALCGYPQYDCLDQHVPQLLYKARHDLWKNTLDIRRCPKGWFYWNERNQTGSVYFPTEAACILAALEATQPKVEKPKERYTYTRCVGIKDESQPGSDWLTLDDICDRLNAAPHYTPEPVVAESATTAATLESVQSKDRYTYHICTDGKNYLIHNGAGFLNGKAVAALLNAPHYTQAQVDEAAAEAWD